MDGHYKKDFMKDNEVPDDSSGVAGRIDAGSLIFRRIDALGNQLNKLPREIINPATNMESGIVYDDIKVSFVNGVNFLMQIVAELDEQNKLKDFNLDEEKDVDKFNDAFRAFKVIIEVINDKDMLFSYTKRAALDEKEVPKDEFGVDCLVYDDEKEI